jgi:thiol-disulfide isomerase/thioredoxin
MRRIIKLKIAFIVLIHTCIGLNAQQNDINQPNFKGTVKLTENRVSGNDTLSVIYRKPYQPFGTIETEIRVTSDKRGQFNFKLPRFSEPIEMRIYLKYKTGIIGQASGQIGAYFLVEENDDIKVDIIKTGNHREDTATFSGRGVEKYNIANLLEKICSNNRADGVLREGIRSIINAGGKIDTSNFEYKVSKYCLLTELLLNRKAELINKSAMNFKMKKLIAYNNAPIFYEWSSQMLGLYKMYKDNPQVSSFLKSKIDKNWNRFNYRYDPLMQYSHQYLRWLANEEYDDLLMKTIPKELEFQDFYNVLKTKYFGPVRELLVSNLFTYHIGWKGTKGFSPKIFDSLMIDSKKYISIPIIKSTYTAKLKLSSGTEISDGTFKDKNGQDVSISSLKGKVVFIDFWFTGCGACMGFNQKFHKEYYPYLKDSKDFIYLSIGLDKQKESWLQGIKSKQYSSDEYTNWNSSSGANHPFIKYYERATFPFMLIVDREGKIYATQFRSEEDVKNKILSALNETGNNSK